VGCLEQIRGLYQILKLPTIIVNIRQDNSSAMQISANGHGNAKRSKYMTVRVEHIKSALEEKKIRLSKCPQVIQQLRIPFRNCCRGVLENSNNILVVYLIVYFNYLIYITLYRNYTSNEYIFACLCP